MRFSHFSALSHKWLWWMAVLIWGTVGTTLAAPPFQGSLHLPFDQIVTRTISNEQFRHLYVFEGRAGQVISLTMARQSNNLDPYLVLVAATGQALVASDDDGFTHNAAINSFRLPDNGEYTVIATRFGHEHGITTGDYDLLLENLGTSTVNERGVTLNYGDSIPGEITGENPDDLYFFQARRGQVINVYMQRISGDLDPMLDLLNAAGQGVFNADDDPASDYWFNAAITNFTIPADGTYFIRATRYGREGGASTGAYLLTLTETPPNTLGTRPRNARVIEYDATVPGSLDIEVPRRYFRFEAQRGDVVFITATPDSNDLALQITLLNSDFIQISRSAVESRPGDVAFIIGAAIPVNGLYYIEVASSQGGGEDEITGTFVLELTGRPGIAITRGLEIIYGTQINGTLEDDNFADLYIFVGQEGDIVSISMRRVSGDIDPLLTLRDEEGKQLASDDDGYAENSQDALIAEFRLPADGIFQIEASRYQRSAGTTSGVYSLELQQEN